MKKVICLLCILVILIAMCGSARATDSLPLSELTDEECISFLENYGVDIPGNNSENTLWIPFVRAVIKMIEENPQIEFSFGYTVALELAYDIKAAVNAYYAVSGVSILSISDTESNTDEILEDNVVFGAWKQEYENYNCYAYAISYSQGINPGKFSETGDEDGDGLPDYIFSANVEDAAKCVRDDLEKIGYTVTQFTMSQPSTIVSDHTKLICIRVDIDGANYYGYSDYHLMKKEEDGNWYHKPGRTNPLRYLYTPSNVRNWVSEGYDGVNQVYFRYPNETYDSNIWYIEYTTPHEWEYKSNGSRQHTITCSICDYEETEICRLEYTNLTSTSHSASCTKCDYYIASQACQLNYRSKDGQTHTVSCTKCENRRTQNCSHRYVSHGDNTHSYLCSMCGYVKIDHAACLFNANNICRTCGTPKNGAVINKQEEITPE